jgi:SPP1 family predicted phage head-tail adaptor
MMYPREPQKSMASNMSHRIQLQTATAAPDGEGGFDTLWTTASIVWASISPIVAIKQAEYKSMGVTATHRIKVRGGVSVGEKQRILYGSRVFEILTIENIQENNVELVITCSEKLRP